MSRKPQSVARVLAVFLTLAAIAACGGGGGGGNNPPPPPPALDITVAVLADGAVGSVYNQTITATGGTGARTFTVSAGALPAGLALTAANGVVSGTPAGPAGTADFTVTVTDTGTPQQTDAQALSITINAAAQGRNDSTATATALGNGTFSASISPSGHPNTAFAPDEDYYAITTTAASTVTVDINAAVNGSPLDSVIEIVNAGGAQLNTCVEPAFTSACVHDDEELGVDLDSLLQIQVNAATTFFVHVVDFRGDARPDLVYDIVISGVN
ncbi:MAG: Ig domain-containing protein [Steroidobacteraceae bacterium]